MPDTSPIPVGVPIVDDVQALQDVQVVDAPARVGDLNINTSSPAIYRRKSKGKTVPPWVYVVGVLMVLGLLGNLIDPSKPTTEKKEKANSGTPTSSSKTTEDRSYSDYDSLPEWQQRGFRSQAQYDEAKEISETYGQNIDDVHVLQEMLRRSGTEDY